MLDERSDPTFEQATDAGAEEPLYLFLPVPPQDLITWNLVGFALILLPTFVPMNYWMNEPGFRFIFEFPMVLAPSIVIPTLISLNLLHAWGSFVILRRT